MVLLGDDLPAAYSSLWIRLGLILERQRPRPEFLVPLHHSAVVGRPWGFVSQDGLLHERLHHHQKAILPLGDVSTLCLPFFSSRCQLFCAVIVNIMDWRMRSVRLSPFLRLMPFAVYEKRSSRTRDRRGAIIAIAIAIAALTALPSPPSQTPSLNQRKSQGW